MEKDIERRLRSECKKNGALCYKWVSPGNVGVPDRIVVHEGNVFFVELKMPGEKPRPSQIVQHKMLSQAGARVYVLDSYLAVDEFIKKNIQDA